MFLSRLGFRGSSNVLKLQTRQKFTEKEIKEIINVTRENKTLYGPLIRKLGPASLKSGREPEKEVEFKEVKKKVPKTSKHQNSKSIENLNESRSEVNRLTNSAIFENNTCRSDNSDLLFTVKALDMKFNVNLTNLLNVSLEGFEISKPESIQISDPQEAPKIVKLRSLPAVTKIIEGTMTIAQREILAKWKKGQIELLGEDGFEAMMQGYRDIGTNLHNAVHEFLRGTPEYKIPVFPNVQGYWKSLSHVLPDVTEVVSLENTIRHPMLYYGGKMDCVAKYKETLCIVEWKTSHSDRRKTKLAHMYDAPMQAAAYAGAFNVQNPNHKVLDAVLVVAYKDGHPANVHYLSKVLLEQFWQKWCQRVYTYWDMLIREKRYLQK